MCPVRVKRKANNEDDEDREAARTTLARLHTVFDYMHLRKKIFPFVDVTYL